MTQRMIHRSLLTSSLVALAASGVLAQDSTVLVEMPQQPNAATVVAVPAEGFSIRVNGEPLTEDSAVSNVARQVDLALAEADVQVVFDGLGATPRLDLEFVGDMSGVQAGDRVTLQSALNYPAYVARAEMRVLDLSGIAGARVVQVVPVDPNGQVQITAPEGPNLVVVHRVYDANGRYDETAGLPLGGPDRRARAQGVEDGADSTVRRGIPVYGGAVTVRGTGVARGAQVATLGEIVEPDGAGGFVLQRILPAGSYDVNVAIQGAGQRVNQNRRITIPASEWFYTGTVDLTYAIRDGDGGRSTAQTGRVAGYIDGRTENGVEVTASIDTGEGDLDQIFRGLDEKDPRQLLLRVDPADLYPTFGDDSTLEDNTPTAGKLYVRVAREGNFVLWGDFQSRLAGNELVRNERALYGLQVHAETTDTTTLGQARASIDLYAAQPERLPQRDIFRGTGGSVYFLEKQDITAASESISIQLTDPVSGRVIETRRLIAGQDYAINYIQGLLTLRHPLQSTAVSAGVIQDASTDAQLELVAQYEYRPTAGDVDGYATGGRIEGWATDNLRVGVSAMQEQTGLADQTLVGADLRYQLSDNSFVQLDYAQSEGRGFGSTYSVDGGLIVEERAAGSGTGEALKATARIDLGDVGVAVDGSISGYFEKRTEGFSNLDTTVRASTGDETLWGLAFAAQATQQLHVAGSIDSYENTVGRVDRSANIEVGYQINQQLTLDLGLEHVDRQDTTEDGQRTDAGARLTYALSDSASLFAFAQVSLKADGLANNDRYGIGGAYAFENGWAVEGEISDGNQGQGGRILVSRSDGAGNESYLGYELQPGRDLNGVTLTGRDRGRVVAGGTRRVTSTVDVFGENTYDLFGQHRSLTSAYGLNYVANDNLQYVAALEYGRVDNGGDTDFDRQAVSFGVTYSDERLSASGRVEYRTEEGTRSGSDLRSETFLVSADGNYKISDSARIIGSLDYADTQTDEGSLLNGTYGDVVLGYAFRPVDNDRLNVLARYRYLHDLYGQRVDGVDEDGPRQRSHVVSVDAIYDLSPRWSVGGKLGYRASETAATAADAFTENDAWLAIGSVTYHTVHEWDAMIELRSFNTVQSGTSDTGVLASVYRHFGNNLKLGVGYNFGRFSDDLTDLVQDDQGAFINLVAKF